MFCKNCGNEIKDDVMFCDKCGTPQDAPAENLASVQEKKSVFQGNVSAIPRKNKKILFILIAIVVIIVFIIVKAVSGNSSDDSSKKTLNENSESAAEISKYQNTNSYGITCNGNNDLAIEAANVFADKYGGSGYDWTLTSVDASVSGMSGTYRYSYTWVGNSYTATTTFTITDYGSYRNYVWEGDFANLFYGG